MREIGTIVVFIQRDFKRAALVIVLAAFVIAESLPNVFAASLPTYGDWDFAVSRTDRVVAAAPTAARDGIRVGDRIDRRAMSLEAQYLFDQPRAGVPVTFGIIHHGAAHSLTRTPRHLPTPWNAELLNLILKKAAVLLIALVAVALILVRPSRVTNGFFAYALGSCMAFPIFYSLFLPFFGYAVLVAMFWIGASVAAPIGFLIVAFRLPRDPPTGWRRLCERAIPCVALVLLARAVWSHVAVPDFGVPPIPFLDDLGPPLTPANLLYLLGDFSLIAALLDRTLVARPGTRMVMAAFAISTLGFFVGAALFDASHALIGYRGLAALVREGAFTFNLLVSLLVAYILIRYRIIDVRFVVDRSILYGTLTLTIVIGFATLNFAFAKQVAQMAAVLPFEIIGAIALGYRLSGFSDVSAALSLADVQAPAAGVRGHRGEEREILARALGRAERTRRANLIAEVRARAAFGAWFAGENDEFKRHLVALDEAVGDRRLRGLGFFIAAASGGLEDRTPSESDLPDWVARGYLIACGSTDDAALARGYATAALDAADESGTPFLRILARIALAEFVPAERERLYAEAADLSQLTGSTELQGDIAKLKSKHA